MARAERAAREAERQEEMVEEMAEWRRRLEAESGVRLQAMRMLRTIDLRRRFFCAPPPQSM